MDCKFCSNAWDDVSHKLNIHIQSIFFFCKICFLCIFSFFFFCGRELMVVTSGTQIYLKGNKGNIERGRSPPGDPQTYSSSFNIFALKNCKSKKRYTKSGGHWIPSSVLGRHDFWIRPYQIWIPKFIRWLKNIYEDYPKAWLDHHELHKGSVNEASYSTDTKT